MIFVRNILRNKTRSILTVLGAALGIAVYVSVQAITGNILRETGEVIASYDTDIIVQRKGAVTPVASRIPVGELARLQAIYGEDVSPIVIRTFREAWNPYALLIGADGALLRRFGLVAGHGVDPGRHEAMVGMQLARRLGLEPGQKFQFGGADFLISGIFSVGSSVIDGAVVLALADAKRLHGAAGAANLALVRVTNKAQTQQRIQAINAGFSSLKASSSSVFVGNIRLFRLIASFANAVGLIAFAGACLVVSITLVMALAERTREIGILMAVGWRPGLVLRMLLAESLTLCIGGALLGVGMALGMLRLLRDNDAFGVGWIPVTLPLSTVITAFAAACLLACVAMLWPAVVISRFSPLEALRHE